MNVINIRLLAELSNFLSFQWVELSAGHRQLEPWWKWTSREEEAWCVVVSMPWLFLTTYYSNTVRWCNQTLWPDDICVNIFLPAVSVSWIISKWPIKSTWSPWTRTRAVHGEWQSSCIDNYHNYYPSSLRISLHLVFEQLFLSGGVIFLLKNGTRPLSTSQLVVPLIIEFFEWVHPYYDNDPFHVFRVLRNRG